MLSLRRITTYFSLILLMGFIIVLSSPVGAQIFSPYFNPYPFMPYYGYGVVPPVRTASFYPGYLPPVAAPALIPPAPVIRTAAATVSLWITGGAHSPSILLIYNPTALIGPSSIPVTPSPLFSLIAGTLLTAGASPLSTANPAFFNYLVNTYLLPTGLAIYAIP